MTFADLGLSDELLRAVDDSGYGEPTPIQTAVIPSVLMGKDIVGIAQTGTGKTAGFGLPMLDMGFIPDIEDICTKLPKQRQTLLFSATMPPPIQKLAAKFLNDHKRVEVARPATANINIEQRLVEVRSDKKRDALRDILRHEEFKNAIVFSNRKSTVRELATSLKRSGFTVGQIQGDMEQADRIAEFDRFKNDEITILVASDVA